MSGNYTEESKPLWRLLRQEGFQFVIVFVNHGQLNAQLAEDIAARLPDVPLLVLSAFELSYSEFLAAYRKMKRGIMLVRDFETVLSLDLDSYGQPHAEKAADNARKQGLLAGLNLRRDLLMASPITLILTVGPHGVEKKARPLMEAMPDLWSRRSLVLDLEMDIPTESLPSFDEIFVTRGLEIEKHDISTLGGVTELEKLQEIKRLEEELNVIGDHRSQRMILLLDQLTKLYQDVAQHGKAQLLKQLRNSIAHGTANSIKSGKNNVFDSRLIAGGNIHVGDTIYGDKIDHQINQGAGSTYIENQTIHQHRAKQARKLTVRPLVPWGYKDRKGEVERIRTLVSPPGQSVVLLYAEGGMGKTSLAAHYWATTASEYAFLAWLYVQGRIEDALLSLAPELKLELDSGLDEEGRLERLFIALSKLEAPCLLVVDDLNEADQLGRFVPRLAALHNFHVLITTRCEPMPGQKAYKVLPLEKDLASDVFQGHYPSFQAHERPYFDRVYDAVGGNTLVLELIGKILGQLNRFEARYPLDQLVADLQEKGLFSVQSTEVISPQAGVAQEYEKVDALVVIRELYGAERMRQVLNAHSQFLLSNLALLPPDGGAFALLKALIVEVSDSGFDFEKSLENLCAIGWVEFDSVSKRIQMSPVVQSIVRERQGDRLLADSLGLVASLKEGIGRGIAKSQMREVAFAGIRILVRYGEFVCHHTREKAELEIARLNESLARYYFDIGDLDASQRAAMRMVKIGKIAKAVDENAADPLDTLATGMDLLGRIAFERGDVEKAVKWYLESIAFAEILVENQPGIIGYQAGLAISKMHIGEVYYEKGSLDKALRWLMDSHQIRIRIMATPGAGPQEKHGLAISFEKLGDVFGRLGNYDVAQFHFRSEMQLLEELSAAYPSNIDFQSGIGSAHYRLGGVLIQLGQLAEAMDHMEAFHQKMQRISEANPMTVDHRAGLALSYLMVGRLIWEHVDNKAVALEKIEKAVFLFQEVVKKAPGVLRYWQNLDHAKELLTRLENESMSSPLAKDSHKEKEIVVMDVINTLDDSQIAIPSLPSGVVGVPLPPVKDLILFLSVISSENYPPLRLDHEYRVIQDALQRGKFRDRFELKHVVVGSLNEWTLAMSLRPRIVHLAGHGDQMGIPIWSTKDNENKMVGILALQHLFNNADNAIELVILSTSHSAVLAKEISKQGVSCAGYNRIISDNMAISAAQGLYIGIVDGSPIVESFRNALISLIVNCPVGAESLEVWKDGIKLEI